MRFIVCHRRVKGKDGRYIEATYTASFARYLRTKHEVLEIGEGFLCSNITMLPNPQDYDFMIDLDSGRNEKGDLHFQLYTQEKRLPSVAWFIDSHGHGSLHSKIAKKYDHVFFAVWDKRDLFANHPSAHWCPNATDMEWFNGYKYSAHTTSDFGFFGSKTGLYRADPLKAVCDRNGWTTDIQQIGGHLNHRWPSTPKSMAACKNLFNMGQKHDGPNQRVLESMAIARPLLTNRDPRDGMSQLFEEGKHCLFYGSEDELEEKAKWLMNPFNKEAIDTMVKTAFKTVATKHQVLARIDQIIKVLEK